MCRASLPIERSLPDILKHCNFQQLKQIHGLLVTSSLSQRPTLSSLFLRRATELGRIAYAELVFYSAGVLPHVLIWNAMIRGYAYNGPHENCLHLLEEMPQRGLKPNEFTYPYVLDACTRLGDCEFGKKVHCRVIKAGVDFVPSIGGSLLNFYIEMERSRLLVGSLTDGRKVFDGLADKKIGLWNRMMSEYVDFGDVESARRLFDEMPERDVVSWNAMLSGYVRAMDVESAKDLFQRMPVKDVVSWTSMIRALADSGDFRAARRLFDDMPVRNVVSWNCMLSSYTHQGRFQQALDLFRQMHAGGIVPDGFTLVSALSACAHLGALEIGKWMHFNLIKDGLQSGAIVGTALVEMYAKCGDIDRAFKIFIKMVKKDVFCWNVMIKALAIHGRVEDAMKLFALMKREGLLLNGFTFMSVLFACSHGGLVEEGRQIFDSMERDFKIQPKIEHYGCLVDLLCRNARLEEAQRVIKEMPYEPDVAVWGALLGGCRTRNDLRLAEKAMERIAEFETNEGGVYALVSNMYAASSEWNEALKARQKMEQRGIWKSKGYSSILEAADVR
ncbi:pentatricopeptide repeat-containing protein [Cocos nucifera]|uniref:Pentatricopeptide repeat-containing protein n=1 Tax=Cocos nucifera TaxID=13894 RepID=A0A8K0N7G1_COCNU|nr:pentatricopeptide repeat-containing protein [Cocos nucifera]